MKCPKCQFENREGAKFCKECGAKLELACPKCGATFTADSKFCDECGYRISLPFEQAPKDLSVDEKIEKIQKYLPKGLAEKILSQKDRIEGERKQVTVMFCDLEEFTALSERLGPEGAYSIMDQIYEILIHKVHDYGGTVNEMTGDGIMALFGAPNALEDGPQRAIRVAFAIHREMVRFGDEIRQEKECVKRLKMRIGIHTGPVVVGTVGNDLRVEFKAIGDTVNLASRMEGLAEPGSTYITEATFKLTEGLFRFEALGAKAVKGKEKPVKVYKVVAPSNRKTRFDVSAEIGLTPFVGRERDLELLLDGFERAKDGSGQAFSIIAEAGVGKSRLLYEFRKAVVNEDVTFLEGKCLSFGRGVAYHPIIDVLKSNFTVQEENRDSEVRKKVKRGLKVLGADEAHTLPYLLELLSVKDSGIDRVSMSPEAKRDRIMEAVKQITLKGSEIRPQVVAIEDLHWIDKSSEECLKNLLNSISGARIFLIFTYRPEYVHPWGGKSYYNQVNLNRFSNRESLAMVTHLLGTESIDSNLEQLILEKTEGVPFFIEEFINSLIDLKIIERKNNTYHIIKDIQVLTIPSTIQDVIMARVDTLPERAKEVLQTGSVIEREFSYDLIKLVSGLPEQELRSQLSVLKDAELLFERGIYPKSAYIFKHSLTQEVAYDSILTTRKKKLHDEIGMAIEELYKKNIHEHYSVLAAHFIEAENYEKGAEYSRLAGKKAEKAASFPDAIAHGKNRVACLEKLPQTDDVDKKIVDARTGLGLYYIYRNYHVESKDAIEPIIDLAVKHGYKKRLSQVYSIIGSYNCFVKDDFPKAFKHLEEALKISGDINDIISSAFANYWLGIALALHCEFEKAFNHLEKVLDINVSANSLWGISLIKSIISHWIYYFQGNLNLSYKTSDEAVRIAEESGDIYSKGVAFTSHGVSCYGKGFFEEATKYLLKGVDFCERSRFFSYNALAEQSLGDTYFEIGEYQKSKDHYGVAIWLLEQNRLVPYWVSLFKISVERAKVMNNEKVTDLESMYNYVYKNKAKNQDGWMSRYIGEILLHINDHHSSEVEDWISKAIEADKRNGMMFHLGRDYALYTELFKRKGDQAKARENLSKAIEIFKECGAEGWVEKYEKKFAALS